MVSRLGLASLSVAALIILAGCAPGGSGAERTGIPTPDGVSVGAPSGSPTAAPTTPAPAPSTPTAAPPTSTAGPTTPKVAPTKPPASPSTPSLTPGIDVNQLPMPQGWKPRSQRVVGESAPSMPWAVERDVAELMLTLRDMSCSPKLISPRWAIEGSYTTDANNMAVIEQLTFRDSGTAKKFTQAYADGSLSCTPKPKLENVPDPVLRRIIGPEKWTEVVVARGSKVMLVMIKGEPSTKYLKALVAKM